MDYKKTNAPTNTVTRDIIALSNDTGNVYETLRIIGKRANQISVEMKNDLEKKLQEFASYNDNLEEVFENREQIEISRYYENYRNRPSSLPKSISKVRFIIKIRPKKKKSSDSCIIRYTERLDYKL